MVVLLTTVKPVMATPFSVTTVAPVKSVPVTVTVTVPSARPLVGVKLTMVGAGTDGAKETPRNTLFEPDTRVIKALGSVVMVGAVL